MEKRIFDTQELESQQAFQPKQEFDEAAHIELEQESPREVEAELIIEESLKPPRFWIRLLLVAMVLFGVAVFAQSIQWLIDTWQAKQWIYFAFSIAFFGMSLAGLGVLGSEWRKLRKLRKHQQEQARSQALLDDKSSTSGAEATQFCKDVLANMHNLPAVYQEQWHKQLDEAYNGQEVLFLFGENVLKPLDKQVKKLISKSATENAIIVAVSPLAIVDVLMVAWRNIALVNKISRLYGMELGYFSRLKLFKMVLTNMAFAGATEIASDVGMDFFSQNLTARLSIRAAQGIGVGLLTARLGIKAMEFCRPVAFSAQERPKLSVIRQELLGTLKEQVFSKVAEKEKVER
ncbi:TIGR01620 family protein [Pasteurellaceae bacterium RH1A]|nr:TIGR01620 family protein [Pasteurellaceae bacterium RH1A]